MPKFYSSKNCLSHHKHPHFWQPQTRPTMNNPHLHHNSQFHRKRKFVYEDETLTLKRYSFRPNWTSKHWESAQSSCSKHKKRAWDDSARRPGFRSWSYSENYKSDLKDKLVVVSYNILGVENASKHPHLYFNIPYKYIDWHHRRALICKELTQYDPSIICLQEVDRFSDLLDTLQHDGYKGILKARTGDAKDGCAIFWKDKRFTLLHEENIEFQSFGLRNNVAQFCVLKMNGDRLDSDLNVSKSKADTPRCLLVGNIHVLFSPKRGDVKLGQIRMFLEKAYKLSEDWGKIPVLLAGDFNSVPQSALYQLISSSKLDLLQHDRNQISGQIDVPLRFGALPFFPNESCRERPSPYRWNNEELKLATGNEQVTLLQHNLKLCSAYLGIPGSGKARDNCGEPLATSCHSKFTGTVDYIWHTDALVPVRVLETLPVNVLRNMGGLPNKNWGSDHLALVCEFAFKR